MKKNSVFQNDFAGKKKKWKEKKKRFISGEGDPTS